MIDAKKIVSLLDQRHIEDLSMSEAEVGNFRRIDYWAMKMSLYNGMPKGYEIKVSRSDFTRDEKWQDYLPFCEQFFFVCPSGLIQPEELPTDVGLLWVAKTGSRLFTKRQAVQREMHPSNLTIMLMRAHKKIRYEGVLQTRASRIKEWKKQLEGKEIGWDISRIISERADIEIEETRKENNKLSDENGYLRDVKKMLERYNIKPDWRAHEKLAEAIGLVSDDMKRDVLRAIGNLQDFGKSIGINEKELRDE